MSVSPAYSKTNTQQSKKYVFDFMRFPMNRLVLMMNEDVQSSSLTIAAGRSADTLPVLMSDWEWFASVEPGSTSRTPLLRLRQAVQTWRERQCPRRCDQLLARCPHPGQ